MRQELLSRTGIVLLVCLTVLLSWLAKERWDRGRLFVTDESGAPVENAVVWVTYGSSPTAYEFRTNSSGYVFMKLRNYKSIHGVSASKDDRSGYILHNITWPLRIVIREEK